jgi:hypothetical protein
MRSAAARRTAACPSKLSLPQWALFPLLLPSTALEEQGIAASDAGEHRHGQRVIYTLTKSARGKALADYAKYLKGVSGSRRLRILARGRPFTDPIGRPTSSADMTPPSSNDLPVQLGVPASSDEQLCLWSTTARKTTAGQ